MAADRDAVFVDEVAKIYESHMVPLIFAPYAAELAERLGALGVTRVLEIAAGTGVATRALADRLPASVSITATDLNPAMLREAEAAGTSRPVEWRQANAMQLPFENGAFDAVVCQFGAMFFPDKAKAFAETRRVLTHGGVFLFSVWDRIEENEFADTVTNAVAELFPDDPPLFLRRTPHGYSDSERVRHDLANGGFDREARITTRAARSRADSPAVPAIAYCKGTPLRDEIVARDPGRLDEATEVTTEAVARVYGRGAVDGKIQAHIVMISK